MVGLGITAIMSGVEELLTGVSETDDMASAASTGVGAIPRARELRAPRVRPSRAPAQNPVKPISTRIVSVQVDLGDSEDQLYSQISKRVASPDRTVNFQITPPPPLAGDEVAIRDMRRTIQECPASMGLFNDAQQAGPIHIGFRSEKELPGFSYWNQAAREINLIRELPPKYKTTYLVSTLCGAKNLDLKEGERCGNGELSRADFIHEKFRSEYRDVACHHDVVSSCVSSNKWSERLNLFKQLFTGEKAPYRTVETAWEDYQINPLSASHRDITRIAWERGCKQAYCRKNPMERECITTG